MRGTPCMIRSIASRSSTSCSSSSWASASSWRRWATISFCAARRPSSIRSWRSSSRILSVRLRQSHVAVGRAPHAGRAHRVVVDHRVGDVGHALEVIRGAGGDRAEDDLLGHASAEQHGHVVEQLLARLQVAVLGGQVERVAERPAARHDRDAVHAVDRRQQLAAQRVPGLVEGHHALLVRVEHALGLDPSDHPLQRGVEVGVGDRLATAPGGEDRGLVADVREVRARQPARLLGDQREVDVLQRLVARVHLQHAEATGHVGGNDEHLAVEAAGAQQRRVELLEQVGRGDHDDPPAGGEAVHLHEQLVERLVLLARDIRAATAAHGVELVDEDDRRFVLARDREQPADASGAEAGEHLDERGRRLGEELRARLVGHRLGEQRLARPRRTVQEDALRHARSERVEGLGIAQELDDLLQLGLGLIDAGDVGEGDRLARGRLDLLRLDPRHHLQRAPHHEDQRGEEQDHHDRRPVVGRRLDFLHEGGLGGRLYRHRVHGARVCLPRGDTRGGARGVPPRAGGMPARRPPCGRRGRRSDVRDRRLCDSRARRGGRRGRRGSLPSHPAPISLDFTILGMV